MKPVLSMWMCCLVCAVASGQAPSLQPPADPLPRQAPASIDGAEGSRVKLGPLPQLAPPPAPFGSAGPVLPANPVPPPFEMSSSANPVGRTRGWLEAEFLLWWINSGPNPMPLATNGSLNDLSPGAFGQQGTTGVFLGGQNFTYNPPAGMRFSGGYWFGEAGRFGIDGSIFFLSQERVHQGLESDANGNPGIYRPVNDVTFGETSLFVAIPGMAAGAMFVSSSSQLWGAEVNGLFRPVQRDNWSLGLIGGFRFLNLRETLHINTITDDFAGVLPGPGSGNAAEVPGSTLAVFDNFRACNDFYGGQIGLQSIWAFAPRWYLSTRAVVALGQTSQNVDINGLTIQDQPGIGLTTAPAGALAIASNSGHFSHRAFSVVPEARFNIGYQFSPRFSGFIGYNFLYWSNVVRPGNLVNRTVDLQGVPTSGIYNPAVAAALPPPPSFSQSGFWAQGINFGLQFRY